MLKENTSFSSNSGYEKIYKSYNPKAKEQKDKEKSKGSKHKSIDKKSLWD